MTADHKLTVDKLTAAHKLLALAVSLAAASLLALLAASPSLAGPSPWWHLTSGARPTSLHSGLAQNEVQKLTISATAGEAFLRRNEPGHVGHVFVPFNASHEALQTLLGTLYGAGNVAVTGGPGDETGSKPYVITFTGALADQPLEPIEAFPLTLTLEEEAIEGTVSVGELTAGRPDGQIVVTAANVGDAGINGEAAPVALLDSLPSGVKAVSIQAFAGLRGFDELPPPECAVESSQLAACTFKEGTLVPYEQIEAVIGVVVEEGASLGAINEVSVSGGKAQSAAIKRSLELNGLPAPFGTEEYEMALEEAGGSLDTQAGSHPFQLTTTFNLNQTADANPVALPKDLSFRLPAGLIGNPTPFPRCSLAQFFNQACSSQTVLGVAMVTYNEPLQLGVRTQQVPIFNVEPSAGEPARFGFLPAKLAPVFVDASVRSGGDYGVTVHVDNITQTIGFLNNVVTFWGVPGNPLHDKARGLDCLVEARGLVPTHPCRPLEESQPPAFLSLPRSCTGPLQTSVDGDSWAQPGAFQSFTGRQMPGDDGCNRLPFDPSIKVTPDGSAGSSPTGLTVNVHVPQEESLNAGGLAEADPKDITVALPQGVVINPAGGNGLQACSEGLVGFTGFTEFQPGVQTATFTGTLPSPILPGVNFCPDESKIGTVRIKTPILPNPIEGFVYLATQNENPFGSLVAIYLIAKDPVSGVLIKLAGNVHLTETGQLITTFENSPQAPFEDAELHFFDGERAPLSTPAQCGPYTTSASIAPWSGNPPSTPSSTFNITSGRHGAPCPGPSLPFSPTLTGGMTNINAGSFGPLSTTIGRADGEQDLQSVQLHMPAGLEGLLTGVKLCPEAQANEGTCGPDSQIGETTVSAGVGSDPVSVKGGRVYITEKYAGAPFGLSIANPVKAGPFDLEHDTANPNNQPACDCVVVRAKIEVDPFTAALTITTDTSGPHAIPHMIDGIPVQIQKVNVLVNRPGFTFNPTNCSPLRITGAITSVQQASSALSVPFQATNCATLKFAPKFTVSTSGKTSKANGASLSVKLAYPNAPFGSQANIAKVKVDLPKQLPSRLATLQKACTAAVFDANPANCPPASIVGQAKIITPLLPVPLSGPAYFVSHGGEAFPDLTMVLQGYGVTVDLVGSTFIKNGVTSSTFKATPDVPFSSFELKLPQGRFSALAANVNLCKSKLTMPTEFLAQNGALLRQATKIAVTGCPKALTRAQKLGRALKACHRKRSHGKRAACERQARKRYGGKKARKKG